MPSTSISTCIYVTFIVNLTTVKCSLYQYRSYVPLCVTTSSRKYILHILNFCLCVPTSKTILNLPFVLCTWSRPKSLIFIIGFYLYREFSRPHNKWNTLLTYTNRHFSVTVILKIIPRYNISIYLDFCYILYLLVNLPVIFTIINVVRTCPVVIYTIYN